MTTGSFPWDGYSLQEQIDNCKKGVYIEPENISPDCSNLIKRMLEVDPKQRATIEEILQHPWVNKGAISPVNSSNTLKPNEIDESIVDLVAALGFDKDQIMRDLTNPLASIQQTVSIYFLFAKHKKNAVDNSSKSQIAANN